MAQGFSGSIAVYGHLAAGIGFGSAARGTLAALRAAGLECRGYDLDRIADGSEPPAHPGERHAVSIVHTNPDHVMRVLSSPGAAGLAPALEDRYTIGYWAWESSTGLPPHGQALHGLFDEIWVPSRFVAHSLSVKLPCPVLDMPHPVTVTRPALGRADLGLPESGFRFLVAFDELSNFTRKNPVGAVLAFRRAFPEADGRAVLVIKARTLSAAGRQRLLDAAGGHAGVTLRVGDDTAERMIGLIAACDALVSLHRAEGFGLVLAEAMALGLPVVATGWSGNVDFTTAENSLLVRHRLVRLERPDGCYPAGTVWAEPDLDHAAILMRRLTDEPQLASRLGNRAEADLRSRFDPQTVGRRMRERLDTLHASGRRPRHRRVRFGPVEGTG